MPQSVLRRFADDAGRPWQAAGLCASAAVDERAVDHEQREPAPLLFVSGSEKRWLCPAPEAWWDLSGEHLAELLPRAREFPHWIGDFNGLFAE